MTGPVVTQLVLVGSKATNVLEILRSLLWAQNGVSMVGTSIVILKAKVR